VLIVETRAGLICANAGVDASNVPGDDVVALLPVDADASAARLRSALTARLGVPMPVIVSDSHGRPWRLGAVGVAIGVAGIEAVADLRGRPDLYGRPLRVSTVGTIDALASAAELVMGEGDEGVPAARIRGARWAASEEAAVSHALRPPELDLFR
jgi:coenzyme F420-0:L-glutamate ligase/coenzyme F420-1:gamma-L-glutamate ligase